MNNYNNISIEYGSVSNLEYSEQAQEAIQQESSVIKGVHRYWIHFKLKISLIGILIHCYSNPIDWFKGLNFLIRLRKKFLGEFRIKKFIRVGNKYYMGLFTPGWRNTIYDRFIISELNQLKPTRHASFRFNHVYLAITNKCPLQCEHCYTWDLLNKKTFYDESSLPKVVAKIQAMGAAQIHLTGGEPLVNVDTVVNLLEKAKPETNFWINTSGFKLTSFNATRLYEAGLTGVLISLDHYIEEAHNEFRGFPNAYKWATEGARNAREAGLVVAFSICLRNDFISEKNMNAYLKLAKNLGVHFVQFLDPKAVGHYRDKAQPLTPENLQYLDKFYEKFNFSDDYLDYPIISFPSYYQRRHGCFASGDRGVYIDPEGGINACPFCHSNVGNILDDNFEEYFNVLKMEGCPTY